MPQTARMPVFLPVDFHKGFSRLQGKTNWKKKKHTVSLYHTAPAKRERVSFRPKFVRPKFVRMRQKFKKKKN